MAANQSRQATDAWELVLVHRFFRREFGRAAALVRDIAAADTQRREAVGGHIERLLAALDRYDAAVDLLVLPKLIERGQLTEQVVERIVGHHERFADEMANVGGWLVRWQSRADPQAKGALSSALGRLLDLLSAHFDEEESMIRPLIGQHVTAAEWADACAYAAARTPAADQPVVLGWMLEDTSMAERDRLLGSLPAPARADWEDSGEQTYRQYLGLLGSTGLLDVARGERGRNRRDGR